MVADARDPANRRSNIYRAGERDILDDLRTRRDRYLGTLLCSPRYGEPDLAGWVARLLPFARPVVWLGSEYQGHPAAIADPLFTRCTPDEARVANCAVEALASLRHLRSTTTAPTGPCR